MPPVRIPHIKSDVEVRQAFQRMAEYLVSSVDAPLLFSAGDLSIDVGDYPPGQALVTDSETPTGYTWSDEVAVDGHAGFQEDLGRLWTNLGTQAGQYGLLSIAYAGRGVCLIGTSDIIAANGGLILRSTDFGATFTSLGRQATQTHIHSICNLGGGVVIAGTQPGGLILRSTNHGLTWTSLGQVHAPDTIIHSLCHVGNGVALAGTSGGHILRSTDNGASWASVQDTTSAVMTITYCRHGIVIAGNKLGRLWRSTDSGATWTNLGQLIMSSGSGVTWIKSSAYLGNGIAVVGTYTPSHIFRSTDYGATWSDNGALGTTEYLSALENLGNGYALAGIDSAIGTPYAIYRTTDFGKTWATVLTSVRINAICNTGTGVVLASETGPSGAQLQRSVALELFGPLDYRYFAESEFINVSAGAADAGKPIVLDAGGKVDDSMINDGDVDHGSLAGLTDDDHALYSLVAGTRAFTGTVGGIDPVASTDLATKNYVDTAIQEVVYVPDTVTLNEGSLDGGDVDSVGTLSDGDTYDVSETATTPGIDIEWDFSSVTSFSRVWIHVKYLPGSHTLEINLWNYDTSAYDTIGTFSSTGDFVFLEYPVDDTNYIDGSGNVKLQINHPDIGNPSHDLFVDYVAVAKAGFGSSNDHGALDGLSDDDHAQYHNDTRGDARYYTETELDAGQLDNRYFTETEHIDTSAGAADAGKPIKLDGDGEIAANMLGKAAAGSDHGALAGLGDDDHTIYLLADGTRNLAGNLGVDALITIDGRDLSVDGSKLDGIEALADVTDAANVAAAGAAMSGGAFHDGFSDFVADEHVAHSGVTLTASTGLTGGGDISASRSFALSHLGIESLTDPNADRILFWDDGAGATAWLTVAGTANTGGAGSALSGTTLTINAGYVSRGDPSAFDVTISSLTLDSTWRDLDLGPGGLAIVPAGAYAVQLNMFVAGNINNEFAVRPNGNSNTRNAIWVRTQQAANYICIDGTVACDSNGIIEYYGVSTLTLVSIVVKGWYI